MASFPLCILCETLRFPLWLFLFYHEGLKGTITKDTQRKRISNANLGLKQKELSLFETTHLNF